MADLQVLGVIMFRRKDRMTPSDNSNIVGASNHQSENHLEKHMFPVPGMFEVRGCGSLVFFFFALIWWSRLGIFPRPWISIQSLIMGSVGQHDEAS